MSASDARVLVAVDGVAGTDLAADLRRAGAEVRGVISSSAPTASAEAARGRSAAAVRDELASVDVLVLAATRVTLTAPLVALCDRLRVRIVAVCAENSDRRWAEMFGVAICERDAAAHEILAPSGLASNPGGSPPTRPGRVITVWGAAGAPGRTTIAVELASELARQGRRVALVDADAHAASIAIVTGLADEGPGFAAACRHAGRGTLTVTELSRIASPLGAVEVLTGINRPGRWPELSHERVCAALECCREWVDDVIVDVAAPLERDEEIVSDVDGPRRNAATLAALESADLVVAVVSADPVGAARFVRAHAELRSLIGPTPVKILANKTRTAAVGVDARGQLRRTLERYSDAGGVWFVPWDPKAADAGLLAGAPVALVAPRSSLASAVRRFVSEAIELPRAGTSDPAPSRRAKRRLTRRRTRAA